VRDDQAGDSLRPGPWVDPRNWFIACAAVHGALIGSEPLAGGHGVRIELAFPRYANYATRDAWVRGEWESLVRDEELGAAEKRSPAQRVALGPLGQERPSVVAAGQRGGHAQTSGGVSESDGSTAAAGVAAPAARGCMPSRLRIDEASGLPLPAGPPVAKVVDVAELHMICGLPVRARRPWPIAWSMTSRRSTSTPT